MPMWDGSDGQAISPIGATTANNKQLSNYLIDTSQPGAVAGPDQVKRRQAYADALMKQGMDSSPAAGGKSGGLLTALNRGMAGALAGYQSGQAQQEEQQGKAAWRQAVSQQLQGDKIDPQAMVALSASPWANPTTLTAFNNAYTAQHQAARDAVSDRHQARMEGLAVNADKRAAYEFEHTPDQYVPNPNAGQPGQPAYIDQYEESKRASSPSARPMTPAERDAYHGPPDTAVAMTKDGPKAIGPQTSVSIDTKAPDKYDTIIGEGIAKAHNGLMGGVEDAQSRARDVAAMQAAVDRIQKNGGSTGGMLQPEILSLQKTINSGANAVGLENPFSEKDLSDKEFLSKFNRQMAGSMAKGAVGSRVTNFELKNYLAANPGLEMSTTGNQRLLGIQGQIEKRNVEVGQQMRMAAAEALSKGQRVNPMQMEKIIRDYDEKHHIFDPVTGQDLAQNYALPEFQSGGSNAGLGAQHDTNIGKIRTWHPEQGVQ